MRVFLFFVTCFCCTLTTRAQSIRVAAAISLRESLTQIAADYEKATGNHIDLTVGSSGQLLAQIKTGASIDLFISAADAQVDELIEKKLADKSTRKFIAGNKLVLIVRNKSDISSFESLAGDNVKKLALGEPKTVPAGFYAMQVLKKLNLEENLKSKLIYGANVRQVLDYVERNEVSAGMVYATDAKEAGDKVKVAATADESTHDPIHYPAIIITASKQQPLAKNFLDYIRSEKGQAVLIAKGFAGADDR